MIFGENNPGARLAGRGLRIQAPTTREQPRRRAVTDLITMHTCPRHARFFSEGRYPTHTPAALMGRLLHRVFKNLHGQYQVEFQRGNAEWIPDETAIREECQVAVEAARMQGLPYLSHEQSARLLSMLQAFHAIEANWFYPRIRSAEVPLSWLWSDSPAGPILLEGKVDVVFLKNGSSSGIALWDYKTGKQPQPGTPELRSYQQQMRLYAFLYRQCYKEVPEETALYFLRELAGKASPTTRPPKALYQVAVTEDDDDDVLKWLTQTLLEEQFYEQHNQWNPPPSGETPQRLCQSCNVRWSCPSYRAPFPWESDSLKRENDDEDFDL